MANTIPSNDTGLRYAEEVVGTPKTLPAAPVWYPAEPNGYADFGGKLSTVARNPINPSRQRKKGTITDLDASGGYNSDLTQTNLTRLLQGFMFADIREKKTTAPMNAAQTLLTGVVGSAHTIAAASGLSGFLANQLVKTSGFAVAANNGLFKVTTSVAALLTLSSGLSDETPAAAVKASHTFTGSFDSVLEAHTAGAAGNDWVVTLVGDSPGAGGVTITVDVASRTVTIHYESGVSTVALVDTAIGALADANDVIDVKTAGTGATTLTAPAANATAALSGGSDGSAAKVEACGYEFASATVDITMVGGLPHLAVVSGGFDLTTLGLIPGEWVYLGGDDAANTFANNAGWARIGALAATYLEFDKVSWTPQAEVGTGKTIRIFFGSVLKNESVAALIKARSYQFERSLGKDGSNRTMSEYLPGTYCDQLTINVRQADKITMDLRLIAMDHEPRDGATGLKPGVRPAIEEADCFNTSSDFSRIKLSPVDPTTSNPTAIFAFGTDLTIDLKNNCSPTKAIGNLGAIGVNVGTFEVGGKITAYFASTEGVESVRNNADVTLDIAMAKKNSGIVVDIPLVTLGDGRANIEKDKPITLPLDLMAAAYPKFDHTMLFDFFPYLPTAAE